MPKKTLCKKRLKANIVLAEGLFIRSHLCWWWANRASEERDKLEENFVVVARMYFFSFPAFNNLRELCTMTWHRSYSTMEKEENRKKYILCPD